MSIKNKLTYVIFCLLFCSELHSQSISLLFVGDAMQHQAQLDNALCQNGLYNYDNNFDVIKQEIASADVSVVNLETTLGGTPYSGYPNFCSPDEYALALKKCGFNIFLTANNHSFDRGIKGLTRTLSVLDSIGVYHTGTYKNSKIRDTKYPLIMIKDNFRIAFLNYTYGINGTYPKPEPVIDFIDTLVIKKDILSAKAKGADIIVACVHWGEEYNLLPSKSQKDLSKWLYKSGIRIVIGSHPHVVQPIEAVYDKNGNIQNITVYSLGNFISNMKTKMTMGGIIFRLSLNKTDEGITINDPRYAKIFTQRPTAITPDLNFGVIGADSSTINNCLLPQKLRLDIKSFSETADKLFLKHNKGKIREYFLDKNVLDSCIR